MTDDTNPAKIEKKLYDLLKDVRIAMMTTVRADGTLHTCPMANQQVDANGDLWFFAEKHSQNAQNIGANPQLSLGYANPKDQNYVAVTGRATLVADAATIGRMWSEELKAWFPKGKEDPNITLIRVMPEHGEYWDSASSVLLHLYGYAKATLTGSQPTELTDHQKIAL